MSQSLYHVNLISKLASLAIEGASWLAANLARPPLNPGHQSLYSTKEGGGPF